MPTSEPDSDSTRFKSTNIANVIPPVSTWPAEKLRPFVYVDLDGESVKLRPSEYAHRDNLPLPFPVDREGYNTVENSDRYWSSGFADWANVCQAMQRYSNVDSAQNKKVNYLDFGCATGRVLRHALTGSGETTEVYGCDFAPANIAWMERHLPPRIQVLLNTATPVLPYADNQFDIVTAFSVFTHIDQDELDWLLELKRITRPTGLLYLTVHNNATWSRIRDRPATLRQFQNQQKFSDNMHVDEEMLAGPIPSERIVFRKNNSAVYNCNVWHSNQYLHRVWGEHFEILHIADCAHSKFQTPVIMRASA